MARLPQIDSHLASLDEVLRSVPATSNPAEIGQFRAALAALRFHLGDPSSRPPILAILGGTGTGKSTLVNRLLNANISAASVRRTFTAGPIAVAQSAASVPENFLDLARKIATELPARGEPETLAIVEHTDDLTAHATLLDTPDLDGDQ